MNIEDLIKLAAKTQASELIERIEKGDTSYKAEMLKLKGETS